jgi:hypothetical protein
MLSEKLEHDPYDDLVQEILDLENERSKMRVVQSSEEEDNG